MIKECGDWQQAKLLLNGMSEPRLSNTWLDKKHIDVYVSTILGYQCQYVRHLTKNGFKSWVVMTNGQENCVYIHNFNGVTEIEVQNIFNN